MAVINEKLFPTKCTIWFEPDGTVTFSDLLADFLPLAGAVNPESLDFIKDGHAEEEKRDMKCL